MAQDKRIELKVFYTLGKHKDGYLERDFGVRVHWSEYDLKGYSYEFLQNVARNPDSLSFWGIQVPHLYQKIISFQPDVVLIFPWKPYSHLKLMMQLKGKVPIWFRGDSTAQSNQNNLFQSLFRYPLLKWVYAHVDGVFSPGKASDAYFKRCGITESKIIRAVHAVDNSRFLEFSADQERELHHLRTQLGLTSSDWVYLFAGKFIEIKNIGLLLKAFQEITSQQQDARLLLLGSGPQEQTLKSQVTQMQLTDKVLFMPHMPQEKMPMVYRLAKVFVLPSKTETWGLSINESLACGVPVIASDGCGAVGDLLVHRSNGLVFKSGDFQDLILQMNDVRNNELYRSIQEHTQSSVQSYGITQLSDSVVNQLLSL